MSYSIQEATSDGTLEQLAVSIEFLDRTHITVLIDNAEVVLGTDWDWLGASDDTVVFTVPVPNGSIVQIVRRTDTAAMLHVFSGGAQFRHDTLDEDLRQLLYMMQEAREGIGIADAYTDLNMHDYRITNVSDPVAPQDALNLRTYEADASGAYQSKLSAAASATYAAGKATAAASSATSASNSAATATSKAATATAAATDAENSATSASNSAASALSIYENTEAMNAAVLSASNSASTATTKAANASTSASAASSSATAAAGSATSASNSAASASASAASAATNSSACITTLNNFLTLSYLADFGSITVSATSTNDYGVLV